MVLRKTEGKRLARAEKKKKLLHLLAGLSEGAALCEIGFQEPRAEC
jgi:hypothetical protein